MEQKGPRSMLEKAAAILNSFSPHDRSLGLSQIAARSDLALSTTHRLVGDMCRLGWLRKAGQRYSLGWSIFELGELVPIKHHLRTAALPYMQELLAATKETIHLAIRDGSDVLYLEKLYQFNAQGLPSRTGGRAPLTCTAVGKALLIHERDEIVDRVLSEPLRSLSPRSITDPETIRAQLVAARRTQLITEVEEAVLGGCCIATPVMVGNRTLAALSIATPAHRFAPEVLGPLLREISVALARQFSARPHPVG